MSLFGTDLVSFLEAMLEICPNNSIKNQFFFFFLYMLKKVNKFLAPLSWIEMKMEFKD